MPLLYYGNSSPSIYHLRTTLIICLLFLAAPIQAQQREKAAQQESPKAEASISPPVASPVISQNADVQQPESPVQQTEAAKHETDRGWKSVTRAEGMQIGINALLFIVVLWQTLIYIQQRNLMRQQVAHAKISERAYIGIENIITERLDLVGAYPNVRITFINGGRTPAYKLKIPGHMTFTKAGLPYPHERPETSKQESESFLPAGSPINCNYPFVIPWTFEWAEAVGSEKYFIFLHVEARFTDAWGDNHVRPFKLAFNSSTERWGEYKNPEDTKPVVEIT
jgi:hypothetical protein